MSLSTHLLLSLCGAVFLVPPSEKPSGSLHPLHPWPQLLDWPHCEVLCNHCVLPPHVLPYRTNLCHLKRCVHQVPPPFPTVSPYLTSSHELVLQYCGGNPLGPSSSLLWPPRSHYYISEMPVIPPYK